MELLLNQEESMVKDSAIEFLNTHAGPSLHRELRDSVSSRGYSSALWDQMVDLGWPAVLVSEDYGGLGFSHVAMGQISEQTGSFLASSPLFASSILGVSVLEYSGTEQQKKDLLPLIAAGELFLALAIDEAPRHNPELVDCKAEKNGSEYILSGVKRYVVDGHISDNLIVSAKIPNNQVNNGSTTLFIVPTASKGIEVTKVPMVDSRNSSTIIFENVHLSEHQILGGVGNGSNVLSAILDIANTHLAAELLGISIESFRRTLRYLKERKQFGVNIGSFQALQHRAATLWSEIELCKSIVLKALRSLDHPNLSTPRLASSAKAKTCKVAALATNEAVQMHGGIGMTDEFDIGFFLKRARVAQLLFGDQRYHTNRVSELSGF
tara:strand:- start:1133 stop:2272 length:1140 start_codon:yes stop_codon:yes gene_type:complete